MLQLSLHATTKKILHAATKTQFSQMNQSIYIFLKFLSQKNGKVNEESTAKSREQLKGEGMGEE